MINGEEIVTTVDHPFYVKNQGFIKAGELIVGDELLDVNGNVLLVENFDVELTEEPVTVYNFQVEDFRLHQGVYRQPAAYQPQQTLYIVHKTGAFQLKQVHLQFKSVYLQNR